MLKIICNNCLSEVTFSNDSAKPAECPYCFAKIDSSIKAEEIPGIRNNAERLCLISQMNQQEINIPAAGITLIGRDSAGAALLKTFLCDGKPVISRKHCSIEFRDGNFILKDENSMNGTFYGINKISCKENPQVIEDNSMIFLGQEAFLAVMKYKKEPEKENIFPVKDEIKKVSVPKRYRCKDCGAEFDQWAQDCPKCQTFNGLVEI